MSLIDRDRTEPSIPVAPMSPAAVVVYALHEVLDEMDDAIDALQEPGTEELRWADPHLRKVYEYLCALLAHLTD